MRFTWLFLLQNEIRLNDHEVKDLLDRMWASGKLKNELRDLRPPKRCGKRGGKVIGFR